MPIRAHAFTRLGLCSLVAVCGKAAAIPPCALEDSPDGSPQEYRAYFEFPCRDESPSDGVRTSADFFGVGAAPEADSHSSAKFLPDGSAVVVANRDSSNLALFDPGTRALIKSIALSGRPENVAISPDGTRAVTANLRDNTASIVDLVAGTEIAVVAVGTSPSTALINPAGSLAVISNTGSQTASVIDLSTNAVVRTFATGGVYTQVSVNPETAAYAFRAYGPALAGDTLVFPDSVSDSIKLVDINTGTTTSLPSTLEPMGVAVTPDGAKAVVTHFGTARILTVVDVPGKVIAKTIPIGADLQGPVTIDPTGAKAVVAVLNACRVVNLSSGAVTDSLSTASVNELYTSADGLYAVCVGFRGSLISYASQTLVKDLNNFVSTSVGAVSPTAPLAVEFSDTFGEDMVVMTTNGAAGSLLSAGPSGPAPEADRARTAAVTPDGLRAVVVSQQSQTASITDPYTGLVSAWIGLDRRPGEVKITPDGAKAVVASRDGTALSVINLAAGTKVDIPISTRADQVQISPDGQFAYVAVVVSDGVWRVNLGTNSVQGAKLTTGDMGSVGFGYQQFAGMALSPDGSTLVTCNSVSNSVSIIDTSSWSVVKTLVVGAVPCEASFSADSSRIYVSNRDTDTISRISSAGAASTLLGTIPVGDGPFLNLPTPDGNKLYVVNWNANSIGVVDLASNVQVKTIPLPAGQFIDGMKLSPDGQALYVTYGQSSITFGVGGYSTATTGSAAIISTTTDTVTQTIPTGSSGAMLALSANGHIAAIPQPWGDGVTILDFVDCPADFDHSGFVDLEDFTGFVHAFEAGTDDADFDHSGFVDLDDFHSFVVEFETGC